MKYISAIAIAATLATAAPARQWCEWAVCHASIYPIFPPGKPPHGCSEGKGFMDSGEMARTFVQRDKNTWHACFPIDAAVREKKITRKEADDERRRYGD